MVPIDRRVCVAPMMGCTDRHCRYLLRLLAPNTMLYSEMLTTGALLHGPTAQLLAHTEDEPCAVQLGGGDPGELALAAKLIEDAGYQEVNLNCGCPSDRVQQGGIGACLMGEPELVARCYEAMAAAVSIPVTIKSRIGIDDQDDYAFFHRFIECSYNAGARHFQVHARKAILKGLSPKENREIPPLKYDYVSQIKRDFPDAEFVLNGGITTASEAAGLLEHFDGVMLGRAPYSNPWLLTEIEALAFNTTPPDRMEVFAHYCEYMSRQIAQGNHLKHMAKHLLGFFTGMPGARAFRRHLSENMFDDEATVAVVDTAASNVTLSSTDPMEHTGT